MCFHQFGPGPYLWAEAPWPGPWPCFHQLGPGSWPWALAPWPGPGPHNIRTLGGMGPRPRAPLKSTQELLPKKNSKTLCVFTSFGLDHICGPTLPGSGPGLVFTSLALGHGPGPWPPGQALGLIAFALWGGWDPGPGPLPKSTQQLLPKKNSKTLCVFTSFGWDHICGPLLPAPGPGHVVTSFGPGSWPWDRVAGEPSAPI